MKAFFSIVNEDRSHCHWWRVAWGIKGIWQASLFFLKKNALFKIRASLYTRLRTFQPVLLGNSSNEGQIPAGYQPRHITTHQFSKNSKNWFWYVTVILKKLKCQKNCSFMKIVGFLRFWIYSQFLRFWGILWLVWFWIFFPPKKPKTGGSFDLEIFK